MRVRFVVGLFLLLTLAAGTASAQTPMQFSIKGGLNFATITGDLGEGASKSMRVGGTFGGGASRVVNDRLTVDLDVLYSMEGVKIKVTDGPFSAEGTAQVDYVRLPVLLRFGAGSGARSSYVLFGPSIAFLVRAKQKIGAETSDLKDELKNGDIGLVFGAGTTVNKIFVEARYTLGLVDTNKVKSDVANKNQLISVLLGTRF
jgi:hypothetical protein